MEESAIEQAMQRAVAAVGRPCHFHIADRNLMRRRADGWCCLGTVRLVDGAKAWQVFWHADTGRGWLWGIRMLADGCVPRRFEPPISASRG